MSNDNEAIKVAMSLFYRKMYDIPEDIPLLIDHKSLSGNGETMYHNLHVSWMLGKEQYSMNHRVEAPKLFRTTKSVY